MHILWIDCEMSGLDENRDKILELAFILTDQNLNHIISNEYIFHQSKEILEQMDDWCKENHSKSNLTEKVLVSSLTYEEAENEILKFLKLYTEQKNVFLAGNSIWNDRNFLKKAMPTLVNWLHYRLIDISTLKMIYFIKNNTYPCFQKTENHRAMLDIQETIEEYRWYQKNLLAI